MDDKYKDYLSYLEFLHRIGRRVGYKSEAPSESMKMTREEQIKLSGLLLIENPKECILMFPGEKIESMLLNNNEVTQVELINAIQQMYIDSFYSEIESLLAKITKAEAAYE